MRGQLWTHIIRHLAHQAGGELNENVLHVYDIVSTSGFVQRTFRIIQDRRQCCIDEGLQIRIAEESQTSFPLDLPKISVSVDDTVACR